MPGTWLRCFVVSAVIAITPLASAAATPKPSTWIVHSTHPVDARIQRQLQYLASQHHAEARFTIQREERPTALAVNDRLQIDLDLDRDAREFSSELKSQCRGCTLDPTLDRADDGYLLNASYGPGTVLKRLRIRASSPEGFHDALLRLPVLLNTAPTALKGSLIPRPQSTQFDPSTGELRIADYPSFPIRGVVEGFYGTPWSYRDRLAVLRFEGRHAMNIYYYGPKDDPYNRSLWREPYPPRQMAQLRELAAAARQNFVHFSFAISPGLSMVYSSDADFATLTRKIRSIHDLGIDDFAIFFDDVPQALVHPQDKAKFSSLAAAHVYVANRLYRYLQSIDPHGNLMVCPTTYTNEWGSREYIKEMGATLNPGISLAWTGPQVESPTITASDAVEWGSFLHRKPLVWDNYPGNDGGRWMVNLGPVTGLDPALPAVTAGLVSNPMYQVQASFIPLQTIADYLWNSEAYDPAKSQTHALVSQYGSDAPQRLAPLLNLYADGGNQFRALYSEPTGVVDIPAIERQIGQLRHALGTLSQQRFTRLVSELTWIPNALNRRLQRVLADPAFQRLPDGKLEKKLNYDSLQARYLAKQPLMDGDFHKWEAGPLYSLTNASQLRDGQQLWKGASEFSARVAIAWDAKNLYLGVDVIDPQIYQPYTGRGIQNGDAFHLVLQAGKGERTAGGRYPNAYDLYFSPGNFANVQPSVYCDQDFFPPRLRPHNYDREFRAVWKKTANGYSGDIAMPIEFFDKSSFQAGDVIPMSFGVQKTVPSAHAPEDGPDQIVFTSKKDKLFTVEGEDPATYQRVTLAPKGH